MVAFMVRVLTHLMRAYSNELDDRRIRAIRPLIPPQVRSRLRLASACDEISLGGACSAVVRC